MRHYVMFLVKSPYSLALGSWPYRHSFCGCSERPAPLHLKTHLSLAHLALPAEGNKACWNIVCIICCFYPFHEYSLLSIMVFGKSRKKGSIVYFGAEMLALWQMLWLHLDTGCIKPGLWQHIAWVRSLFRCKEIAFWRQGYFCYL